MTRATRCCCGERTLHVFGWISIVWFLSALSFAGGNVVQLQTSPEVLASCGDSVTLTCNASSLQSVDILLFTWFGGNKSLCEDAGVGPDPEVRCESSAGLLQHVLTLTLPNVMPVNQGTYICKLRSRLGAQWNVTILTVKDCLDSSRSLVSGSHAECRFSGVYPRATVHWFQGDDNVTDGATTREEKDARGRYNILSKVAVEEGNRNQSVTCSLWMREESKYLSTRSVPGSRDEGTRAGRAAALQWICVLAQVAMLKSTA